MINSPLKLRLHVLPRLSENTTDLRWHIVTAHSDKVDAYPAILEFENPLNGTWHPVEVFDDTETKKPA